MAWPPCSGATTPNLDRYVAVKVLPSYMTEDPTFIGRFRQEAQTIAKLSHPNILQIYDFGDDKGFNYIVSELVLGGDLQDKLGHEAMDLDGVVKYMAPLSEALDYAHAQGIVHRDLKPANVLIDTEDRPILADFGLARMLESTQRFTQASQALGTLGIYGAGAGYGRRCGPQVGPVCLGHNGLSDAPGGNSVQGGNPRRDPYGARPQATFRCQAS